MKVLVITNDFPPRVGGINYYVDQIMRRFPSGEVTVFAASWPGCEAFDPTFPHPVVRWDGTNMLPYPRVKRQVVQLVRSEGADIVLFGAAAPLGLLGPQIERETGVPYAAFTHGVEIAATRLPGARQLFAQIGRRATLITAVSEWTRDIIRDVVGRGPRLELLPPGIDTETFRPDIDAEFLRERYALGPGPVISCVSRVVERKGQDMLIRAMPRILREFPDAKLLIVGKGPYLPKLRTLAVETGVTGSVVFTGEVPYEELAHHFRIGDVFAMPCRTRMMGLDLEAYGAVYLQAYAVGRPCVGGDSGGAPEPVRDGELGYVANGRSVSSVATSVLKLLRDPERAIKMGEAGAAWVHRDLTWDAVANRLRAMLLEETGS